MKDGVVSLEINPKLASRIPSDVMARVEAARSDIVAGKLKVPSTEF
jgi:hypothetical protein